MKIRISIGRFLERIWNKLEKRFPEIDGPVAEFVWNVGIKLFGPRYIYHPFQNSALESESEKATDQDALESDYQNFPIRNFDKIGKTWSSYSSDYDVSAYEEWQHRRSDRRVYVLDYDTYYSEFSKYISDYNYGRIGDITLDIDGIDLSSPEKCADHGLAPGAMFPIVIEGLKSEIAPLHVQKISISSSHHFFLISDAKIDTVHLSSRSHFEARRCEIKRVTFDGSDAESAPSTWFSDCQIGEIQLMRNCVQTLELQRCTLKRMAYVDWSHPSAQPFAGPVRIEKCKFTKDRNLKGRSQEFRTLRHKLAEIGNVGAAGQLLSAELHAERSSLPLGFRFLSLLYGWTSDYGNSVYRPVVTWALLFALSLPIYSAVSSHVQCLEVAVPTGINLYFEECKNSISLALAAALDPLGLVNAVPEAKPTATKLFFTHAVHRFLSLICYVTLIIAVRRRFRIS